MITHNLSDKKKFPHFYKYMFADAISVYSNVKMKVGEFLKIGDQVFKITKNTEHKGNTKKAVFRGTETLHYDFKLIKVYNRTNAKIHNT